MTKNKNSHPEGCICEQLAYLPYLGVYPNTSDMNELSEMPAVALGRFIKRENSIVLWRG